MTTLTVFYTTITGTYAGFYTGIDAGYFADEGIDIQLTSIANTSNAIAGLLSGGGELSTLDGASTVGADVTGADLRIIIALVNHLPLSLMVQPNITSAADLKGKIVGETTPGSTSDTAAHQALQVLGLSPSDVTLQPLQSNPAIFAGLQTHEIDAGILSPPFTFEAQQAGATELVNLTTQGPPFLSTGIGGRASYISSNQTLLQGFVRAYSRGVARFKQDKPYGIQVIEKYLQLTDPTIAEDTWEDANRDLPNIPLADPQGVLNAIALEAATQPSAAGTSPDQYLDPQFVQNLVDQGYYQQLGLQ